MEKTSIAVLVSGGGTNLQALIDAQNSGIINHGRITAVISSKPDAYALKRAEAAGIPAYTADRKALGQGFEQELRRIIRQAGAELIVLAGFMSILSADFTESYPERIINVHPSLIPSFCGKGYYGLKVHEAALARSEADRSDGSFRKRHTGRRKNNNAEGGRGARRRHTGSAPAESHARSGMDNSSHGGRKNRRRNCG